MKATGIVRNVDELGRIVLPVELRRKYGIDVDHPVEIYTDDNRIVLKKYEPSIPEELSIPDIKNMDGKPVWVVPEKNPVDYADDVSEWMLVVTDEECLLSNRGDLAFYDIPGNYKLYPKEW